MPSFYQSIISVISKPSDKRTDDEIHYILAWFLNLFKKKSSVFGDIKPEIVKDIIKNCSFETKNYNDIIIKQGDVGDCFYINLRGKVSIYINHQKHDEEDRLDLDDNEENEMPGDLNQSQSESFDRSRKLREKLGNYVTSLGAGEGFGEIALVSDENRTATIIADETTDLMVVNKSLYARCLQAPTLRKLEEKRDFINKSPFFGNWAPKMKKLLSLCLERDIIPYDSYLGLQGEPADKIYFIITGQAKVIVNPSKHSAQYPKMYPLKLPENDKKIMLIDRKNRGNSGRMIGIKRRNQTFAEAEWNLKTRQMEVGIIGSGEIAGMCEIIFDMPSYMQSTKCLEDCDVYYIYKRSYERLISKRNSFCINKMKDYVHMKLSARNIRLKNLYPIDLYRSIQYMIELSKRKMSINDFEFLGKNMKKKYPKIKAKIETNLVTHFNHEHGEEKVQEIEQHEQESFQDVALADLESRMREWHHDLGYEKVSVIPLNRKLTTEKTPAEIKEGINICIKRTLNNLKPNEFRSRSNSDALSTNSSSESASLDQETFTGSNHIKFVKADTNEAKFFNALSIKLLPLNAFDESLSQSNDSYQNFSNNSSLVNKRKNSASSNPYEDINESRILNDSLLISDKYKRKQSMPNIIFNRRESNQVRKYSIGQIKVQHTGKQYSKEEYMALKDELKKQLRKYSLSNIHV